MFQVFKREPGVRDRKKEKNLNVLDYVMNFSCPLMSTRVLCLYSVLILMNNRNRIKLVKGA